MTKPNDQTKNIEFSVIPGLTGVILPERYKSSKHHSGLY